MPDKQKKYFLIAIGVAAITIFTLSTFGIPKDDIGLSRYILNGLVNGSYGIEKLIDWKALRAGNVDVAGVFSQYTTDKQRSNYKKAFVKGFSASFKQTGAKMSDFINWRIFEKGPETATVAIDGQGGTVLFTLSNQDSAKKLVKIEWKPKKPSQP